MNTWMLLVAVAFVVFPEANSLKCAGGKEGKHEFDCKGNAKKCFTLYCGKKKSTVMDRGCDWKEGVGASRHHPLSCEAANLRLCEGLGTCRLCTGEKCNGGSTLSFLLLPLLTSLVITFALK